MEICLAKEVGVSDNWQKVSFVGVSCIHIIAVLVCHSQCSSIGKVPFLWTSVKVGW